MPLWGGKTSSHPVACRLRSGAWQEPRPRRARCRSTERAAAGRAGRHHDVPRPRNGLDPPPLRRRGERRAAGRAGRVGRRRVTSPARRGVEEALPWETISPQPTPIARTRSPDEHRDLHVRAGLPVSEVRERRGRRRAVPGHAGRAGRGDVLVRVLVALLLRRVARRRRVDGAARARYARRGDGFWLLGYTLLFLDPSLILVSVGLLVVWAVWFALWLVYVCFVAGPSPASRPRRRPSGSLVTRTGVQRPCAGGAGSGGA